jgi:hypothetical protein
MPTERSDRRQTPRLSQGVRQAEPDPHAREKPTVTSPEISEFRAHAFQAAVSKACELGWIV